MKTILAIFLIIAAGLAWFYLTPQHVNFLWYVLLAVTCIISLLLVIAPGDKFKEHEIKIDEARQRLMAMGEQIVPRFDDCEFSESSYGIKDQVLKNENVGQSMIIYHYSEGSNVETFKQALPVNAESLKSYVLSKKVVLYVDRANRNNYSFEIKK